MKRDTYSAILELREIAHCLSIANAQVYKQEINDIHFTIQKIQEGRSEFINLEFILSHLIMRAKDHGLQTKA